MHWIVDIAMILASVAISVAVAMFCLEVLCALLRRRALESPPLQSDARIAVLIPAHNEAVVIGPTLRTLLPTLPSGGRAVVVADNCTDATATTARQCGAEVIERHETVRRGKGFALDFGMRHLELDPPAAVVFLDADCRVASDTVRLLAAAAIHAQRPVQGLNLCQADTKGGSLQVVSMLAFRFKNLVRARGLARLADVSHLSGTGMALPWALAQQAKLASDNLAEDMQLGLDLAIAGRPAMFVPEALVESPLPSSAASARTQRTRWEHGHLRIIGRQAPRLLWQALKQRRLDLAWLALDLAIPPLALLALVLATFVALTAVSRVLGGTAMPLLITGAAIASLVAAITTGWAAFCRRQVPLVALLTAPLYIAAKLPIYLAFVFKRQQAWVRTERDPAAT
jgi:cellulose synthase/poly-beta-1,6-N-acetylglucosamine synthase-like glycosyltransferase